MTLDTSLSSVSGIGPQFSQKLKKLNLETAGDLLYYFPSRYEDYRELCAIADLMPGQQASVQGEIKSVEARRAWRKRLFLTEAVIEDSSGDIRAVWFNQAYLKNILRPGRRISVAGKVGSDSKGLLFSHPAYELLGKTAHGNREADTRNTARIVPIYPETKGVTSRGLRFALKSVLEDLPPLEEWIPEAILKKHDFQKLPEAIRAIHFPETHEDAENARRRFSFENLFLLQISGLEQKHRLSEEGAPKIAYSIPDIKEMLKRLPFTLTLSQKRSLWEIIQDMAKDHPMNRLLEGDVGSGKTIVAALAALVAAGDGYQTAMMAPTEVLARQHYETFKKLFAFIPKSRQISVGFLTSNQALIFYENDLEAKTTRKKLQEKIKTGEVKIVIGTHALLYQGKGSDESGRAYNRLGLVVIDEQHRFGVRQRQLLARRQTPSDTRTHAGESGIDFRRGVYDTARGSRRGSAAGPQESAFSLPHFLSMSATPIPRTLVLSVFGDLDLSMITELPSGRKNIETRAVSPEDRGKAYEFIRKRIKEGRQAFVICPRIDPPQTNADDTPTNADYRRGSALWEVKAVKEEYEKLSKKIFPEFKIAMLHGRMKSAEKKNIMDEFKEGRAELLVSTSVVEVGVDVPNAVIMMIEGADRFGLAQLYQFRGRVGRGEYKSYCFLFADSPSAKTERRLKAVVNARSGFELAEEDLKLRGPGEFLGTEQTGFSDTLMQALQNPELVAKGREAAQSLLASDPSLKRFPLLKSRLEEFNGKIHPE